MRVYKTKEFGRFARREKIGDAELCEAVKRAEHGLIDASLGGGLIKQRVARAGHGRSGGYRTIVAFRAGDRSVFLYGFAKSGKANLDEKELAAYKLLAGAFLAANATAFQAMTDAGELFEVDCDGD